ncbi:MAG: UDP-N-acetylglucosamine--N-acetylmuramyl-(pentapeptide) pyrophosphoryl-undecaprenol N-acetylglucosamine transferase [Chloroflexota bacterium]|nr:MAG: UDP-N-acetylglucosamine--N-acetylmuramyl-(pentapeptide) pyrophosphoryl-undecaprenol N-acetylglucosamine transferase [Chloroflexota bacterium]
MRLLVTGGGTGGHVYPLVAVLEQLAAPTITRQTHEVLYLGRDASVEQRIAANLNIPFVGMRVGGVRGKTFATQAQNSARLLQASTLAAREVERFKPDVALATGGYVSAPVIWAAWRKKIPVVIELPDLEPGWAIRATWRFSRQVAVSFEQVLEFFPRGRATVTGYPVRQAFFQATRATGRAHFQLDMNFPVTTIFGGSQGAHALNESARANLKALTAATQTLHICGAHDRAALEAARAQLDAKAQARYRVFEYLDADMPLALAAADVIVARAGAATLGEFPAVGAPSILIPGMFAQRHQTKNAAFLAARGAAMILAEEKLETDFAPTLLSLLNDPARLETMRRAARTLARPDAAQRIVQLLQEARA